jgi:hypothetical protein
MDRKFLPLSTPPPASKKTVLGVLVVLSLTFSVSYSFRSAPSVSKIKKRPLTFRPIISATKSFTATTTLEATSASAAYLDSLSYYSTTQHDALLGATSQYLDSLSRHILAFDDMIEAPALQQQPPSPQWSAEMLQQATEDLTQALLQMTSSDDTLQFDGNSPFSSPTLLADAKYLWDMDIVDQKGRVVDPSSFLATSSSSWNAPSIDPQATIADLTRSLNDMVNQFTAETTKTASSAANAARNIQLPPSLPKTNNLPLFKSTNLYSNPLDTVSQKANAVSTQFSESLQDAWQSTRQQLAQAGQSTQTALSTANAATPFPAKSLGATHNHMSATDFASSQGFSHDLSGVAELIVATLVSAPRAILDVATHEYAPTALDDARHSLYQDIWQPLTAPLQQFAILEPLQQAQAVLKVLQLLLAVVVAVPRALMESFTGMTAVEFQYSIAQWDIHDISQSMVQLSSAIVTAIIALLKLIVSVTSALVGVGVAGASNGGGGAAAASSASTTQEILLSSTATFLSQKFLPAVIDGLLLVIQQIVELLLQGGSMVVSGL